jgi:SAM-dependent methyltransferase
MDPRLYDELQRVEQTHWWFCARRRIVWALVRRYLGNATGRRLKVCELGCGTGGNLIPLADSHDVVGIESSPEALAHAQRALGDRVRFGRLADEIAIPSASCDVVLITDVLEHIEDDAASARTAVHLLRTGGIAVATVPAYQWLYSPRDAHHHHLRRYSKRDFAALWQIDGADTVMVSHYNTLLFPLAAAVRLASKFASSNSIPGDLQVPPGPINRLLTAVMASEALALGRVPFPFGLSLVAVVRRLEA